jgi:chemotaxis protein CheX
VKAEYVNPFILAVSKVFKDMCMMDLQIGKPVLSGSQYQADASIIELGLTGGLSGNVVMNLSHATALGIVSKMMMMPVSTIDEIGQSAISELGNMIAGNAATIFASNNIIIDITTPAYFEGKNYPGMQGQKLSIPFHSEAGEIYVDVNVQEA